MSMKRDKQKGRKGERISYAGIPRIVMDNYDYRSLSGGAIKLLLELARQYRGANNGDLTTAFSVLKRRGFSSKDTIKRATDELIEKALIIRTRIGIFINPGGRCALYALTWLKINECPGKGLEVNETVTPFRKFSMENNKKPRPEVGRGSSLKSGRKEARDKKGRYTSALKSGRLKVVR